MRIPTIMRSRLTMGETTAGGIEEVIKAFLSAKFGLCRLQNVNDESARFWWRRVGTYVVLVDDDLDES